MLTYLLFDGYYLFRMKRSAISPSVDQQQKKYIWLGIYASLFNICVYAWRITKTHFAYTTADLQPPDPWSRTYSEATQIRYLVPMYRVSYVMTPIRIVLELILRLQKSLTTSFQHYADLFVPLGFQRFYRRLDSSFLHYSYRFFKYPIVALHPGLPALTVGDLWAIGSMMFLLFDGPGRYYKYMIIVPTNLIFCQHLNYRIPWTFLESLVHHDALEVRGTIYQMRKDSESPWPLKLKLDARKAGESRIHKHDPKMDFLGYTFYNDDEIKAKGRMHQFQGCLLHANIYQACHLVRVMPSYDHLTYNCQAFVQNLFRRVVAHEFRSEGLYPQPRHRTLYGYQNQRSNALILMVWYLTFTEKQLLIYPLHLHCMPIFILLRLDYFYKFSVFATCTWHGKPASNRVALTQLLTAYLILYTLDINLDIILNLRSRFTEGDLLPTYNRMVTEIEAGSLLCISVTTMVNILFKLFHLNSHVDHVYPKLGWHRKVGFGSEGEKVQVRHYKPNSNQPVKSYTCY